MVRISYLSNILSLLEEPRWLGRNWCNFNTVKIRIKSWHLVRLVWLTLFPYGFVPIVSAQLCWDIFKDLWPCGHFALADQDLSLIYPVSLQTEEFSALQYGSLKFVHKSVDMGYWFKCRSVKILTRQLFLAGTLAWFVNYLPISHLILSSIFKSISRVKSLRIWNVKNPIYNEVSNYVLQTFFCSFHAQNKLYMLFKIMLGRNYYIMQAWEEKV